MNRFFLNKEINKDQQIIIEGDNFHHCIIVLKHKVGDNILVFDKKEDGGYISPIECVGDYNTFVSRIRQDSTIENGLNIWCVSDNLRKGAALNAVQIAELYINKFKLNQYGS